MQRQLCSVGAGDQDVVGGNLVDRRGAVPLDIDLDVAGQPFRSPPLVALALAQQHRAAGLELLRKHRHGLAGARDLLAVPRSFSGGHNDFGSTVADFDDEVRSGGRILRHLAGGLILLGDRAADVLEHGADRLDRLRNPVHGFRRTRRVLLQRLDLPGDLLGGVLGLHGERLDFGRHHGKAPAGFARARRLDGGIERKQRGLPGDLRNQVDHIADRRRGLAQTIHIGTGFAGCRAGLVRELAGVAHLRADAFRGTGEFFRGLRERRRGVPGGRGAAGQRVGALADRGKGRRGGFGAAGHRMGCALELADHAAKLEFEKFEDFPGRIGLRHRGLSRLGCRAWRRTRHSRFRQSLSK